MGETMIIMLFAAWLAFVGLNIKEDIKHESDSNYQQRASETYAKWR